MTEYKTIVLQKGLEDEAVDDYQFRKIKSILRKELKLTKKMKDDYDRIQMADHMEDKFPKDAGLDKLIKVCQKIKELKGLAKKLKTERSKVKKLKKGKNKTAVKKRKQDEPSSSESLSTNNELSRSKLSSKKKRKKNIKTEGGKKMKLTQEKTELLEPSGSNTQKDEGYLETPHNPPPTPSSSSSNKENTNIKKPSTIKIQVSQKEHQLPEFSATSNSSAGSELQTLQGLSAATSSSLQTPQKHLETRLTLKSCLGSPAQPCQNFPVSPASDSSIYLNSQVPLTLSSGVQASPSATASDNIWFPHMPSETVSSSLSTPQMSPVSVSSSTQNIHLSTTAAANSKQSPHTPQVITSRPAQTPRGPSATLKSKTWVGMMAPATACNNNIQVPEAMPRNDCTTPMPQRATSSGIQTLNTATLEAPRNAKVPGPLKTGGTYFLACLASPATASSCSQASQVLLPTTSNTPPAPQVPIAIGTSSVQTTQTHSGAASNFIQAPHAPPLTEFKNVCTTQVPQAVSSNTRQALPCPKVTASRSVHATQISSTTASKSFLAPCASPPTASSSILDPLVSPATAFSALQAPLTLPATTSSSPSRTPKRENLPKEPSKVEGHHGDPKEVTVLKVTETFTYDLINNKKMFHATVATETEFFRVKVFDIALKNKFIPKKIIAISDYFGINGFLEIHEASCVSDVDVNGTMVIPNTLRQRANGTPKIKDLFFQEKGTYVNGKFVVTKKNERNDFIYYGIEDDTGKMEVVVYGRLTSIKCEPGKKLQLVCFELTTSGDMWQLKSVRHSYMKVINARRKVTQS